MAPISHKTIHQKSDFAVYFAVFRTYNTIYLPVQPCIKEFYCIFVSVIAQTITKLLYSKVLKV